MTTKIIPGIRVSLGGFFVLIKESKGQEVVTRRFFQRETGCCEVLKWNCELVLVLKPIVAIRVKEQLSVTDCET